MALDVDQRVRKMYCIEYLRSLRRASQLSIEFTEDKLGAFPGDADHGAHYFTVGGPHAGGREIYILTSHEDAETNVA